MYPGHVFLPTLLSFAVFCVARCEVHAAHQSAQRVPHHAKGSFVPEHKGVPRWRLAVSTSTAFSFVLKARGADAERHVDLRPNVKVCDGASAVFGNVNEIGQRRFLLCLLDSKLVPHPRR